MLELVLHVITHAFIVEDPIKATVIFLCRSSAELDFTPIYMIVIISLVKPVYTLAKLVFPPYTATHVATMHRKGMELQIASAQNSTQMTILIKGVIYAPTLVKPAILN